MWFDFTLTYSIDHTRVMPSLTYLQNSVLNNFFIPDWLPFPLLSALLTQSSQLPFEVQGILFHKLPEVQSDGFWGSWPLGWVRTSARDLFPLLFSSMFPLSTWKHWIHHVFMCFVDHVPLLFFAKKKKIMIFMAHFIHLPLALVSFTIKLLYRVQVLGRQMP